jgi:phospho-N-acetylmuramoyl-pentapeptide-transferase
LEFKKLEFKKKIMLYYLFEYLDKVLNIPGTGVFQYITFRSALALILSLLISTIFGKKIINFLRNQQVGETVRELGLQGQTQKAGTPTMGGLIIIIATLIPVLLFTKLNNIYIILLIVTTLWMGTIGFIDDYIKIFKKDKEGLKGIFKVIGQVGLGVIVGSVLYIHPGVTVRNDVVKPNITLNQTQNVINQAPVEEKSTATTIPFLKNNEFDYAELLAWTGEGYEKWAWLIFIPVVIFIITAVSNGANLTDGIDGLAAGTSAISVLALGIFTFVSGNIIFSSYLNIMYIPNSGEMTVFIAAFVGALVGFLWYNSYPASVFMGDTGSLTIGGIIAVLAISVRKEMLIPLLCGIFLAENLSVVLQVSYFKYTKKRFGEGRRIFLMSPLHHHYQKKGYHESKIVTRFWIVGILLAILSIVTLKLR